MPPPTFVVLETPVHVAGTNTEAALSIYPVVIMSVGGQMLSEQ